MSNFQQRKKDILSKNDKSFIGKWDKKIKKLCEKINSVKEYYTTSSCSGRIVILLDKNKKEKGLFLRVSHDLINFKEIKSIKQKLNLNKNLLYSMLHARHKKMLKVY